MGKDAYLRYLEKKISYIRLPSPDTQDAVIACYSISAASDAIESSAFPAADAETKVYDYEEDVCDLASAVGFADIERVCARCR